MAHHSAVGLIEIKFLRWHDYCAYYEHNVGQQSYADGAYWAAFQWLEDYVAGYKDGHWTAFQSDRFRNDLEDLARFARETIEVTKGQFQTPPHNPARQIEALDWPLFHGKATPTERNKFDEPWVFASLGQEPYFVMVRADKAGEPLFDAPAFERELYLRARNQLDGFERILDAHCTVEKPFYLPGPQLEDWQMDRTYTWYTDTDEEQRRRFMSDLGKPKKADPKKPGSKKTSVLELDPVTQGDMELATRDMDSKGRRTMPYGDDTDGVTSVLDAVRMRRRAAAAPKRRN